MSGFIGLNQEPETQVQEEIDDTKEIQLEEAFKLYQNALKLHSLAHDADTFRDAFEAYQELFRSEVFRYPEVVAGFANDQLEDTSPSVVLEGDQEPTAVVPGAAAETSATSVPLLIYLAFKNRGQFVLDVARFKLREQESQVPDVRRYYSKSCSDSLKDFADALERDDTDIDLWKKAARVAEVVSIPRIARFCFESVFAGDDDNSDSAIDLSGLDESYAFAEITSLLTVVQDDLSLMQNGPQKAKSKLLKLLQTVDDPYPYLPQRGKSLEYSDYRRRPIGFSVQRHNIPIVSTRQEDLGSILLETLAEYQEGDLVLDPGSAVAFDIPDNLRSNYKMQTTVVATAEVVSHDEQSASINSHEIVESPRKHVTDFDTTAATESGPTKHSLHSSTQVHGNNTSDSPPKTNNAAQTGVIEHAELSAPDTVAAGPETTVIDLPTRKRSSTVAGNEEPESRTKSKRLRARDSLADLPAHEEDVPHDMTKYYQDQLSWYVEMDTLFLDQCSELYQLLGLEGYGSVASISKDFWNQSLDILPEDRTRAASARSLYDLRHSLTSWTDERSQALLHGHGNQDFVEKSAGLTLFLQHSKANAPKERKTSIIDDDNMFFDFIDGINANCVNINEVVLEWLRSLLTGSGRGDTTRASSYLREEWPAELKHSIIQLIVKADEYLYSRMHDLYLQQADASLRSQVITHTPPITIAVITEFVQSIFELHLDIQAAITNPSSQTDEVARIEHGDRVSRWAQLASCLMQLALNESQGELQPSEPLILRFLWSSVTCAGQVENVDKAHLLLCLDDLRRVLQTHNDPVIALPNNVAMPLISASAVEKERSRLSTLDFFISVFDTDNSDPVAVIEKLEPILESKQNASESSVPSGVNHETEELIDFLDSGDAALRLFLWRRLQNAYTAISYTPKVVSCLLRSIEAIVNELQSSRHATLAAEDRQNSMLRWFKDADEILGKVLMKITSDGSALDFLDRQHIKASLHAVMFLIRVLHGFAIFEDSVRIGQIALGTLRGASATRAFDRSRDKLREMLVRLWTLQYILLKEGLKQNESEVERADDRLAHYLNAAHRALGYRQYCRCSNKVFVRLARSELLLLQPVGDFTAEIAQVLYDLYRVKVYTGLVDEHHECPFENVDKKTATALLPFIMNYANRLTMRDLVKSDLKGTIEKIQHSLGNVKANVVLSQNKKLITAYLKAVVNPLELYRCIRGIGDIPTKTVRSESAKIASCGWYFLLGHLALARYKSTKRISPSLTEDLDIAAQYLRHDLEHGSENWESWYRLAQVYDAKIEDDLIWNSTKLNESRSDIAVNERCAVHAYCMATALAMRTADDQTETVRKVEEMFSDFGLRLYASSRPPLHMEAFKTDKHMRHMSSSFDQSMSKEPYCKPIRPYALWDFTAHLLHTSLSDKPKPWLTHYALGKCLWKMLQHPQNVRSRRPITVDSVIAAFTDAIEALPKKEKSTEYILEPHFKLVSTVHKCVRCSMLEPEHGAGILQATRFAHEVQLLEDEQGRPEWNTYVLDILKRLGNADKSNWHHRIIARAAHVIYDDQQNLAGALGAKHQFTQQIFTKTMTLQVWKPEFERPGRHYVYTGRYVLFFMKLLDQLNDRSSFDQLLRRIRRKQTDFIDHEKIWEDAATTYVKLLRRMGKVPEGRERAVFDAMSHEDFTRNSEKVEAWAHDPDTTSAVVDIMRDAIELKKLNNSLMKGPLIDDLIGDAYATLYESYISQLPVEVQAPPQAPTTTAGTFINLTTNHAPTGDDNLDRMRMGNFILAPGDSGPSTSHDKKEHPLLGLGLQTPPPAMNTTQQTPIPDPARVLTPSKPGRAKTITKREIQRKAESAIVKPPPIKTPTLSKKPIIEIALRRPSLESNAETPSNLPKPPFMDNGEEDEADSRQSSRRNSIHDSADIEAGADADDESGLSDGLSAQDEGPDAGNGWDDDVVSVDDAVDAMEVKMSDQQEIEIGYSPGRYVDDDTPAADYETADEDQPGARQ